MANREFFLEMVSIAQKVKDARWAVGGNAPVMANRLAMEGSEVLLGARVSPNVNFPDFVTGWFNNTVTQSVCYHHLFIFFLLYHIKVLGAKKKMTFMLYLSMIRMRSGGIL